MRKIFGTVPGCTVYMIMHLFTIENETEDQRMRRIFLRKSKETYGKFRLSDIMKEKDCGTGEREGEVYNN